MKISKIVKCNCDGWIHIAQGPCSCWVCQSTVSFEKWQTGKGEELREKPGFGAPLTLDPDTRWWNPDSRDPLKDLYAVTFRKDKISYIPREPGYDQCFAGDDRWDEDVREQFECIPATIQGYTVINKQFGL
jgi:hypothetical protein